MLRTRMVPARPTPALTSVTQLLLAIACACLLSACSKPEYDTSTPQATLDSMHAMIRDGHAERLADVIHIQPRDITYADGVTEASAISEVIAKAGDMIAQLYNVSEKLRTRYASEVQAEAARLAPPPAGEPANPVEARQRGLDFLARFLSDPFGLMDEQKSRLSVEDAGDGTADILLDNKPVLGVGLQMKDVDGSWKVDVPIDYLQRFRPETREEWAVLASMMLSFENALTQFETELDRGDFRDLSQASERAGRLLGERAIVQAFIFQAMKNNDSD